MTYLEVQKEIDFLIKNGGLLNILSSLVDSTQNTEVQPILIKALEEYEEWYNET